MTSYKPSFPNFYPEQALTPFLKWPGGKRWIAKDLAWLISSLLKGRYYEPFLGGGAVFFSLRPKEATLTDINGDLINVYCQVKDHPGEVVARLQKLQVSREDYYLIREQEPTDPIDRAVRFLYLNRTAFGGIYRVNPFGKFNVPYGGGERTPEILWRENLVEKASEALQNTVIMTSDFQTVIDNAVSGDVVYCDPTYTVAHENNGFIRYNEKNFSWADQERLASCTKRAVERGVTVLVSNASHSSLANLYLTFNHITLKRKSCVSKKIEARREIKESLFVLSANEEKDRLLGLLNVMKQDT